MAWMGDAGRRLAAPTAQRFSTQCSDPKEEPTLPKRLLLLGNPATRRWWVGQRDIRHQEERQGPELSVVPNAMLNWKARGLPRALARGGRRADTQLRGSGLVGAVETISPRCRNKTMRRETGAEPEHTAFPGVTQRELEPGVHRLRGQVPSPRGAKSCLVPTGGGSEGEALLD